MKRFIISPPFGNWISHPACTRILGSYTFKKRRGLIWNALKTLRPIKGGWVNRIGLRNPGMTGIKVRDDDVIYSIVGIEPDDWDKLLFLVPTGDPIEINLGCPNVHEYGIEPEMLRAYCENNRVMVKLPPTEAIDDIAAMCVEMGAKYLHCSNTIPTARGGESGKRLKEINLPIVERLHNRYPDIPIIAGGGIYSREDVLDYERAGATHFSLATVWFLPWRAKKIIAEDQAHSARGA